MFAQSELEATVQYGLCPNLVPRVSQIRRPPAAIPVPLSGSGRLTAPIPHYRGVASGNPARLSAGRRAIATLASGERGNQRPSRPRARRRPPQRSPAARPPNSTEDRSRRIALGPCRRPIDGAFRTGRQPASITPANASRQRSALLTIRRYVHCVCTQRTALRAVHTGSAAKRCRTSKGSRATPAAYGTDVFTQRLSTSETIVPMTSMSDTQSNDR